MPTSFSAIKPGIKLADQVASALEAEIRAGRIKATDKLPTEAALALQFQVSRTVVREAISRLKSLGLVESRQGSGVYAQAAGFSPLNFDARHAGSLEAVVQMVEVRRALESEVAALAAERRTPADLEQIQACLQALDDAVAAGRDGVEEDVHLHRTIAEAARNPFLMSTLDYLGQFLRGATRVTRANEARRVDFARAVREEHLRIVDAIAHADPAGARAAAATHMHNAIDRIQQADPAFWLHEGEALARPLTTRKPSA